MQQGPGIPTNTQGIDWVEQETIPVFQGARNDACLIRNKYMGSA